MIKGVTKNIIEVKNPDSMYFERAVFYLKPDISELPAEFSEQETERYISELKRRYRNRRKHHPLVRLFLYAGLLISVGMIIFAVSY